MVEDMTADDHYTNPRRCSIVTSGIEVLRGVSLLQSASHTRMPGGYNINCYGQNGDWSIEMKDLTLWHCLSDSTHPFDVATVEQSWSAPGFGGYDSDEAHDYVYAPVRYRQPFGENDDEVSIYHLRPSLSIYWMVIRAFRQMGYKVNSEFMNSAFFRKLVMPWVWGDFYDLNSMVIDALKIKASGRVPAIAPIGFPTASGFTEYIFFAGAALSSIPSEDADNTGWTPWHYLINTPGASGYIYSRTQTIPAAPLKYHNFKMDNVAPPSGYDNLALYSFDNATGKMIYTFNPPASIAGYISGSVGLNFSLSLICKIKCQSSTSSVHARLYVETTVTPVTGPTIVTLINIPDLSTTTSGATVGSLITPTVFDFTVPGVSIGDTVSLRLWYDLSAEIPDSINIMCSERINVDPGYTGASNWQFNYATGEWGFVQGSSSGTQWQPMYSSISLTGLQLNLGGSVNFKLYDKFRSYKFLDLLRGLVDMFNLSIQTNPIDKEVTIEPTHEYRMPGTGTLTDGYFKRNREDWTAKQDLSKESTTLLFSETERQLDMQFKQDGSDGAQNIYTARYKGVNLNNVTTNRINGNAIDNGIYASVPGAARYMFPSRFRQGTRQMVNRFFSATMHYRHEAWRNIFGASPLTPAPQLITIFPESINDSSGSAITQTYEPKIAYYKGFGDPIVDGGWKWKGDPAAPYTGATLTSFPLPLMFAVNYGTGGENDPALTYCDQKINGTTATGLLRNFFLKRMAIMRNGKQYKTYVSLKAGDMTNWLHRERIIINGATYTLIGIENYNPISDTAAQCILWKEVQPEAEDSNAIYPSPLALTGATSLTQFDLRYAPLLVFNSDIPQVQ
jgi:hypothetical protein